MRRWIYGVQAIVVFVVGIASRTVPTESVLIGKYLGDALYAVLFYLCLAITWPWQSVARRVVATTVFVICIECFQLTGIPMGMRESGNKIPELVSIVLGTKFSEYDLLAYAVGIIAVAAIDWLVKAWLRKREPKQHVSALPDN